MGELNNTYIDSACNYIVHALNALGELMDRRHTILTRTLIVMASIFALVALMGAASATVTYDGTKVMISNGEENLTTIDQSLSDPSLLERPSAKNWLLKVPLQVENTGTFYINDSDCDWLKLLSLNDGNEAWIRNFGTLAITNTKITSWNTSANDFAPLPDDYVTTRSYIYSDGTMNIYNSNVSYLGDGVDWRSKGVYLMNVDQFQIINSTFFHNFIGIRAYGATNAVIENCTIRRTKEYGIRIEHSSSDNVTFNNNTVIDNNGEVRFEGGNHTVTNNTIYAVELDGDGIDIKGWYCTVANNEIFNCSPHGGIDLHSFSGTPVHDNIVEYNTLYDLGAAYGAHAIYVHNEGAYNNIVRHNIMWNISSDDVVIGPYAYNNTFLNNTGDGCFSIYNAQNNNVSDCDFSTFFVGSKPIETDTNISYGNVFLNNIGNYETENLNGVGINTVRNPATKAFAVQLQDTSDVVNIEFTDGNTFALNGDTGGHTSVTLTEVGTYKIEVESAAPLITSLQNEPPTQRTIDLYWDCSALDVDHYTIHQNGALLDTTESQYYSATNLTPDTTYTFGVSATTTAGITGDSASITVRTAAEESFGSNTFYIADDVTASKGSYVTVPVMIYDATGVACAGVKLTYDVSAVNVIGVTQGDFTTYFGFDDESAADGWVLINTYVNETSLTGDVKIADLILKAVGDAGDTSPLDMEIIAMADQNGRPVSGTVSNGLFTVVSDTSPPVVADPSASQLIPDDTNGVPSWGETATLSVTVTDESDITSVTIDLSAIGGSPVQPMTHIGGDNVWSVTTSASAGTPPQTYELQVCATDIYGYTNMSESVELVVMRNGDVTGDGDVRPDDVTLLENYVTYSGYTISSEFVADVTGDGVVDIADAMLLANRVTDPDQYTLR